jgi:putative copper export protein
MMNFDRFILFLVMNICVGVSVCHKYVVPEEVIRVLDPLEVELQGVLSCPT